MAYLYVPKDDTKTYLTFASSKPSKDRWLIISFMVDDEPLELISDLNDTGWSNEFAQMIPLVEMPPLNGRKQMELHAQGSKLFGDWTDDEHKTNMANARRVLRKHGYKGVPHWKLTIADMM